MSVLTGFAGGVLLAIYIWYVTLVRQRNRAREALSSIDVELRKRHDLLPSILEWANQFMSHEKGLLDRIVHLRISALESYRPDQPEAVRRHLMAESELDRALGSLMVAVENDPELRDQATINTAQHSYSEVEGHIAAARRFYNSAVTELNNAIESFPGNLLAALAGVRAMPFYELDDPQLAETVPVSDHLSPQH